MRNFSVQTLILYRDSFNDQEVYNSYRAFIENDGWQPVMELCDVYVIYYKDVPAIDG